MPLLAWLLFTRISEAYVNQPSASHLSTLTHTRACVCTREVGIMSASEHQMYLLPVFSVCPAVCLSVCLPAGSLSACNLAFHVLGIVLFTDINFL